jgi:hypothetical protein
MALPHVILLAAAVSGIGVAMITAWRLGRLDGAVAISRSGHAWRSQFVVRLYGP